jgi:hypothetical protein
MPVQGLSPEVHVEERGDVFQASGSMGEEKKWDRRSNMSSFRNPRRLRLRA